MALENTFDILIAPNKEGCLSDGLWVLAHFLTHITSESVRIGYLASPRIPPLLPHINKIIA